MSEQPLAAPPIDVELGAVLAIMKDRMPTGITLAQIPALRESMPRVSATDVLEGRAITHEERVVPVDGGAIAVSIFTASGHTTAGPGILYIHGGGMTMGDRFVGADSYLDWVEQLDAVVVSVEYRLAPEFPDPVPVNDCYAGLVWAAAHADELGFDPARLVVAGASAGGGLAAGVSLMARDEGGPALAGSLLACPMLDDRNETVSSHQVVGLGAYDRASNELGWEALLGDRRGTDRVSIYASPSRATDLSGLPPTFIDVASVEVFRDEAVAYACRIWEHAGAAELHVWPGGFHGFEVLVPTAQLSVEAKAARTNWLRRTVGG